MTRGLGSYLWEAAGLSRDDPAVDSEVGSSRFGISTSRAARAGTASGWFASRFRHHVTTLLEAK